MTELHDAVTEGESLRRLNAQLLRRAHEAEQALAAFTQGEIDAVMREGSSTPVLLRAAEQALRRSDALFRAVIEKSAEVMSLTKPDGQTHYLTPSAWRLLGWTPDEMARQTLRDHVVAEDQPRFAAELARLSQSGVRDVAMEFRARHRDASIRWIEWTGTNLLDDPDVGALVNNYRDVTARKQAEAALHESRDLLQEAQAIAHVGSWTSGLEQGAPISWSLECYRIFGQPNGTPITVEAFISYVHPDDRERVVRASRDATERNAPYDIEHRVLRPDGVTAWVHERAVVERDATGHALSLHGTVQDITERRRALAELQASEVRYRRIVENTSEGVWTYDAEGLTTFMNVRMASMLGYSVTEVLGQPIYGFMAAPTQVSAQLRVARREQGAAERVEASLLCHDGTELWTSIQMNPLFDADGLFEGALALVTDVSEQKRAHEARARLAAIVESSDDAILSASLDWYDHQLEQGRRDALPVLERRDGRQVDIPTRFARDAGTGKKLACRGSAR